jgi:hypothetical protein
MTEEMMSLAGLIEKAPDTDFLREMISFAATRTYIQGISTCSVDDLVKALGMPVFPKAGLCGEIDEATYVKVRENGVSGL